MIIAILAINIDKLSATNFSTLHMCDKIAVVKNKFYKFDCLSCRAFKRKQIKHHSYGLTELLYNKYPDYHIENQ